MTGFPARIRLLLVEDDEDDYFIFNEVLEEIPDQDYILDWAENYSSAADLIHSNAYDVMLFDYRLTGSTGLDLLHEVRAGGIDTPVIILTGQESTRVDIEAMRAGATDYLTKDRIDKETLERTIRYAIERRRSEVEMHKLAHYDHLTGLPNRKLFNDRLSQTIARARRSSHQFAVMFVDLDDFKMVNDSLGHKLGDIFLQEVSDRLDGVLRSHDMMARKESPAGRSEDAEDAVARLGGDEFTIIVDDLANEEAACTVAERLLTSLNTPFEIEGNELFASASIGIAIFPEDGETPDTLLANADAAMYLAKKRGKNSYHLHNRRGDNELKEKFTLSNQLRQALRNEEFFLVYQPQIEISSGRIVGAEALLRWDHPDRGITAPGTFISTAEESGAIIEIGRWVLHAACRQYQEWKQQGIDVGYVGVNVSCRQFMADGFVDMVREAISTYSLKNGELALELTESIMIENTERNLAQLDELKALGAGIYIDDFGTGYASLSYLYRMPVDGIKLDGSFVNDLESHKKGKAIVSAVIAVAKALEVKLVIEGIETGSQLLHVTNLGARLAQGYLLAMPMKTEEFEEFFHTTSPPMKSRKGA